MRNEILKILLAGIPYLSPGTMADQINALLAPELEKARKWDRVKEIASSMADCSKKGRINNPIVSFPGESNPSAKLSKSDTDEIKKRLATGEVQRIIALDFGVSQSQISNINRGLQWK